MESSESKPSIPIPTPDAPPTTEPAKEGGRPTADNVIEQAIDGFAADVSTVTVEGLTNLYTWIETTYSDTAATKEITELLNYFNRHPDGQEAFKMANQVLREMHQKNREKRKKLDEQVRLRADIKGE